MIERQSARVDQSARQRFGLVKSVQVLQRVSSEQQRLGAVGFLCVEAQSAELSQLVEAGIEAGTGLLDIEPAQAFQEDLGLAGARDGLLQPTNLSVQPGVRVPGRKWSDDDGAWIRGGRWRWRRRRRRFGPRDLHGSVVAA